jgi:hypothetical protein
LIQNVSLHDSIVAIFDSTAFLWRLFQQYRPKPEVAAHVGKNVSRSPRLLIGLERTVASLSRASDSNHCMVICITLRGRGDYAVDDNPQLLRAQAVRLFAMAIHIREIQPMYADKLIAEAIELEDRATAIDDAAIRKKNAE